MNGIRKEDGRVDGTRVALMVGLSIGLGIVVHEVFFLFGGAIAVGALAAAVTHATAGHVEQTRPSRQHS